ncbi:MAG: PAS domain-containing protein [Adhaeribacter sp.]
MTANSAVQTPLDLSLFVNAFPGAVAFLDPGLLVRHVNKGFLDFTGGERKDFLGKAAWTLLPQQNAGQSQALRQALQTVRDTGQTLTLSGQLAGLLPATSDRQTSDWVLSPVPGPEGQLAGIILQAGGFARPRQLGQEKQRNQDLLQAIQQNLNDVAWDYDLESHRVWWSNGFKTAFGYSHQDADRIADCWYSRIHPQDAGRVIAGIQQVIDSDLTLWSETYRFQKKNGEYADLLTRGSVLRDAQGKAYRMIGTMVDITLHRKTSPQWAGEEFSLAY